MSSVLKYGLSSLADAHQPRLAAAGGLARRQSQRCCELSPVGQVPSVADGGEDRRRSQRTYALGGPDALTVFMSLKRQMNLLVGGFDLAVQFRKLFVETMEEATANLSQLVLRIFQRSRRAAAQRAYMVWQYDPVLGQQASDLIDQLGRAGELSAAYTLSALQILLLN